MGKSQCSRLPRNVDIRGRLAGGISSGMEPEPRKWRACKQGWLQERQDPMWGIPLGRHPPHSPHSPCNHGQKSTCGAVHEIWHPGMVGGNAGRARWESLMSCSTCCNGLWPTEILVSGASNPLTMQHRRPFQAQGPT